MDYLTGKPDLTYLLKVTNVVELCEELGIEHAARHYRGLEANDVPITVWGPMVWSAPVLHPEECDQLVEFADHHREDFCPNDQEKPAYRIDELLLIDHNKKLYDLYTFLAWHRLAPLFQLMMGHRPEKVSSIQLARFTTESTSQTDWHVDEDSEMTCVVSLAPERHRGGGVKLMAYGPVVAPISIPPLPKGHGLFFNGRMIYHKAEPVLSGERLLLVNWFMGGGGLAKDGGNTV